MLEKYPKLPETHNELVEKMMGSSDGIPFIAMSIQRMVPELRNLYQMKAITFISNLSASSQLTREPYTPIPHWSIPEADPSMSYQGVCTKDL